MRQVFTNPNEGVRLMRIGSRLVLIAGRRDREVRGDGIGLWSQPARGEGVLMVVGIAGVVRSLIMASTARRTEVARQSVRVDDVEPQRVDDPLI